jgi:transcription elongation factor Elf1
MNNTHNSRLCFVSSADLRCPNCNSTDLKKVSLVYQQGLSHTVAHTRQRAVAVGCGLGFLIGTATSRGVHQSVLSKSTKPPSEVAVPKVGSLVGGGVWLDRLDRLLYNQLYETFFYCFVASVDSFRMSVVIFLVLLVLFWRHNQFAYKRRYSQWDRSFLCQRCGTLTE